MNDASVPTSTTTSDYDALADLFLADEPAVPAQQVARMRLVSAPPEEAPELKFAPAASRVTPAVSAATAPAPASTPAGPAHIEGAIVGHLPVLASAWLTQYARHEADQAREPVALVRFHDDHVSLDLVLPSGSKPPAGIAARPGENLGAVVQRAAFLWRRWLIRVDHNAESQLLRTRLSSLALLTGADEAAVVSSYQLIKGLSDSGAGEPPPPVRLVLMGANEAKAGEAEQSLRRAASEFLGATIEDAVRIPKIGAALSVQIYRGPASLGLDDVLDALRAIRGGGEASRIAVPKADQVPLVIPKVEAAPLAIPELARAEPKLGAKRTALNDDSRPRPAGLGPLNLECPYAPGIELARDDEGRLHLLGRVGDVIPTTAEAAQRLLTAAAWAHAHAKLLTAAAPDLRDAGSPVLHVLTMDAKAARGLLDTGMRVHLMTRGESGGAAGWVVTDLN